jgi:hypothetical protein
VNDHEIEYGGFGDPNADPTETYARRPLAMLAAGQREKLRANARKGTWRKHATTYLLERAEQEISELREAVDRCDAIEAYREAADVANFAMMVADNVRAEWLRRCASAVVDMLSVRRFQFVNERGLCDAIENALRNAGLPNVEREKILNRGDRVDFLAFGAIVIEVKIDGPASAVLRQLHRYAKNDTCERLILVTSRFAHASAMPEEILGVPLDVVTLEASAL